MQRVSASAAFALIAALFLLSLSLVLGGMREPVCAAPPARCQLPPAARFALPAAAPRRAPPRLRVRRRACVAVAGAQGIMIVSRCPGKVRGASLGRLRGGAGPLALALAALRLLPARGAARDGSCVGYVCLTFVLGFLALQARWQSRPPLPLASARSSLHAALPGLQLSAAALRGRARGLRAPGVRPPLLVLPRDHRRGVGPRAPRRSAAHEAAAAPRACARQPRRRARAAAAAAPSGYARRTGRRLHSQERLCRAASGPTLDPGLLVAVSGAALGFATDGVSLFLMYAGVGLAYVYIPASRGLVSALVGADDQARARPPTNRL